MLLSLRNNLHPGNRKSPSGAEKQNNLGNFGLYQPNTSHGKNDGVNDITEKKTLIHTENRSHQANLT